MDLVIMAAGLGSRFGGLKQLEPIDEAHNFIIDYSIFDAIRAGFDHVVFIIKEDFFEDFKKTIGKRIEKHIKVDYVFQNNENIPADYNIPSERTKPFGTGHAILCAKEKISSDFAVINADDFYGLDAFLVAANFLKTNENPNSYALIAYKTGNTLSESGSVKRGLCIHKNGTLENIIESSIEKLNDGSILATPLAENMTPTIIKDDSLVSMNLFAFPKSFLNYLNDFFLEFLNKNKNDLSSCEFFLPTAVSKLIFLNKAIVNVLPTDSKWFGITYKADLIPFKNAIKNMKSQKIYPNNLWN